MKKQFTFLFFILSLLLSITSCSDKDNEVEETLSVSKSQLFFKISSEKQIITIKSNTRWEIDKNIPSWCTVSPMSGKGDVTITVEAKENTQEVRLTTQLVIKTKTKIQKVSIQQEAAPPAPLEGYYFPLLTINTKNGTPITSKDDYMDATIKIESRDNKGAIKEKLMEADTEIKGRGNSTWGMEKKPYKLKLKESAQVLGMPKNKHWVLLANYSDKTLMRNELAFEISRRMGFAWTPRIQYVDVVLNGEYIGNYMLGEHIRVDKNRVNIPELKTADTDITGGYLLEIDERKGEPVWFETLEAKMTFCVNTPEDIPANQKEYISNYIQNIENIIYGKEDANPIEELPKYLDMKSFIDYLLLNELSKNVDGNLRLSTFVYKNRGDDKLYFGPVWDYDIAFGNVNYDNCDMVSGWHARTRAPWYQQFFSHPEFENMVKDRWNELRGNELSDANINTFIDNMAGKINVSQYYNFQKWPILNMQVWPNPIVTGSYQGEVNYLKTWIKNRLSWMDPQLK